MAVAIPASVRCGSADVPLYTYTQLANLSRVNLRQRMLNLRDSTIGAQLPPLPAGGGVIEWLIGAQVLVAQEAGLALGPADFGAPPPPPPQAKLLDKELGRLWEAGVKPPATADVEAAAASTRSLRGSGMSGAASANVVPWANPMSVSREEFFHDPSFIQAAADARMESVTAKGRHRGSVSTFLFGDASAEEPKANPAYKFEPPFQVAPHGYPSSFSGGTTTAASYKAYPGRPASGAEAARARNKGSYTFG